MPEILRTALACLVLALMFGAPIYLLVATLLVQRYPKLDGILLPRHKPTTFCSFAYGGGRRAYDINHGCP